MKKITRRLTAVLVCLTMSMALMSSAFAANTEGDSYADLKASIAAAKAAGDPYADMKESIYQQLKAQNALQHYDLQVAALIPQEGTPTSRATKSWTARAGGTLNYSYDYTYRGEDGYVNASITYAGKEDTQKLLAGKFGSYGDLGVAVLGIALGETLIGSVLAVYGLASAIGNTTAKISITNAGGYSQTSVTYDSISGTKSAVLYGWDTYPTVALNRNDAYDVSFMYPR